MLQRDWMYVIQLCNSFLSGRLDKINSKSISMESTEDIKSLIELMRDHKLHTILRNSKFVENVFPDWTLPYFADKKDKEIANTYWAESAKIIKQLSEHELSYAVVKGVPLSFLLYSEPYARGIGDVDILVKDEEFTRAFDVLISAGYYRTQSTGLKFPVIYYGIHHHEIGLVKDFAPCKVYVEIKRSTSALNSFEQWWPHVTQKTINGLTLNVLEDNFEILHLILNAFVNNESFSVFQDCWLRDYFDVAYAIKHVNFSWQVVLDAAEDMKVTHQIAAVLRSVKELFSAVGEQVDEVLSLIEKKYCKYEQTLFYYGMDKFDPTNYGLIENRPRADMSYSMFDRDFSTYQWNKSYRAVLYSKKNPDYLKRVFLFPNESTVSYSYRNEAGINANYRFFRREKEFIVEVNIEHTCKEVFKNNRCNIDVTWYNSDINSPTIYLKTHSPEIHNLETIDWDKYVDGEQCIGYYSGAEYARIMDAEAKIPAHITSGQEGNITRVFFSFDKDQLFYPLDVLLLEVKFVFAIAGDEEDILIDQGTVEHFIECVDHSK